MKTKTSLAACGALVLLSTFNLQLSTFAQGTAFTYQGRLTDGGNAPNGSYDLTFSVWSAATGPSQVGSTLTNLVVAVNNGLFAVTLDFGNQFSGSGRWLEIAGRTNGSGTFGTLTPRQPITPTPYAIMSNTASNLLGALPAAQLSGTVGNGQLADNSVTSAKILNGAVTSAALANNAVTSARILDGTIVGADLANNTVGSDQLADTISLGDSNSVGQLDVFYGNTLLNQPAISLFGGGSQISTYGSDGKEQIRLWGSIWGEILLYDSTITNNIAVVLSANNNAGGFLSLNNTNGSARARLDGGNSGGSLLLYDASGTQTINLASAGNSSFTGGNVGIGLTSPGFPLHIGSTLGTGVINGSAQRAVVENATANGRAALLLLAGPAVNGFATNRVEVQVEASDSERRAIIGTASDHEVQFRQNNQVRMTLATNGNVGIGTGNPTNKLHVAGGVSATVFVTTSDRNAKENFSPVDTRVMLEKVVALPITQWNFKEDRATPHVGPMAQEFYAAFKVGAGPGGIATVDADGVALAAIQGLNQKLEAEAKEKDARIAALENDLLELKRAVSKLSERKN